MATIHHHLTANTIQMASPLIPSKSIKIPAPKTPLPLPIEKMGSRAPIVVSELEEEEENEEDLLLMSVEGDEDGEERDDLEELQDFHALLMPAARESAVRRLNSLNNAGEREKMKEDGNELQNGQQIHRRQRPAAHQKGGKLNPFVASKFPVIDEDLLALATRKGANGMVTGNAPPNLCRLITNVSECRWTAKRPESPLNTNGNEENGEEVPPKFTMRRQQQPEMAIKNNSSLLRTPTIVHHNEAICRLSVLSMVSNVSSYGPPGALEDATNCDCTSLAMSTLRRSAFSNLSGKRRKQLEQRKMATSKLDLDDSYRKISPSTSSQMNGQNGTNTNDSGISSSSESSRSTSLSEGTNSSTIQSNITKKMNCTNCGRKFLPPSAKRPTTAQSVALLSRRRRALNYLLGNMMRILEMPSMKKCECNRYGGGTMNLKLISSQRVASSTPMGNVPMISIEMVQENDERKVIKKVLINRKFALKYHTK